MTSVAPALAERNAARNNKPVTGRVRLICRCGQYGHLIALNGQTYRLETLRDGYRVLRLDGGTVKIYHLAANLVCDCPDSTQRRRFCKHSGAVRALKEHGKIA